MAGISSANTVSVTSTTNAAIAVVAPTARPTQHSINSTMVAKSQLQSTQQQQAPPPPPQQQQAPQQPPQTNTVFVSTGRAFPHHHIHSIGPAQVPPGAGQWPMVEPVFHFGPGFEKQNYCPTHSQGPQPPEHVVFFHVSPGVSVTFQIAGNREIIRGPATVPMVSQGGSPPVAMPVQVPPGHVMQQIVDEHRTLRHVILSTNHQMHAQSTVQDMPHLQGHYIAANNPTQHYFSPITTGLPGPGVGPPHYHAMPTNHLHQQPMPHNLHSPTQPINNYHKDERTQRQHTKLLRKLDQKHSNNYNSSSSSTLANAPKTEQTNGVQKKPKNGVYEEPEDASSLPDEEEDIQSIIDQLSSVQTPVISEITSRTALLQWSEPTTTAPDKGVTINSRDLRYEVLLSDRGKEDKYKIIFKGHSLSCRVRDLRPGQEYSVCLQVYLEEVHGSASEAATFVTPACEPDQPLPPKLIARTKNSLQLRWNAPADNGAHIQHYILEYDEGKGNEFIEITKMKGKQYSLSKLMASTWYSFRLAAVNECGKSVYSNIVTYSTSGNPPLQLPPPILQHSTSSSLRLAWSRRTLDEEFVLQISDCESGHGFLTCYTGKETSYECTNLNRAAAFQFRIRAENEGGASIWSELVTFTTQPEQPGRPQKPQIKGKVHSTNFRARWEPPTDKGGADIMLYHLEISTGTDFETIYTGKDIEAVCDRLQPGTTYLIRVACEGPGGLSMYSEPTSVTTDAVVPGTPSAPFCGSTPGPYAAVLRWELPEYNGGAAITEHELEVESADDGLKWTAYKGKEMYSIAKDLSPGKLYFAQVRAHNRIGAGAWSEQLQFTAGAAPPTSPEMPQIAIRSGTHLTVTWNEPYANGAPIQEYQLACAADDQNGNFNICYQGITCSAEIKNLIPFTKYYFKVCAINTAGTSPYSSVTFAQTPAAVPNAPKIESHKVTATNITVFWKEPENNGAPITHYCIEFGDRLVETENEELEYTIENLSPETAYKIKIKAVNEIGCGPFSHALRATTNPLPPMPPVLECVNVGHNSLKLKWGDGKHLNLTKYRLQMYNSRAKEYQVIYSNIFNTFKVIKLQEQTTYMFRICAETDHAGLGSYSDDYAFRTSATIPSSVKPPRITEVNQKLAIEWQPSKNTFSDAIEYVLQMSTREQDFVQVYRGRDTQFTIENVDADLTYTFRVHPVRLTQSGDLPGPLSPTSKHKMESIVDNTRLATLNSPRDADVVDASISKGTVGKYISKISSIYSNRKKLSDNEKAIIYVVVFMVLTIVFASIVRLFIS